MTERYDISFAVRAFLVFSFALFVLIPTAGRANLNSCFLFFSQDRKVLLRVDQLIRKGHVSREPQEKIEVIHEIARSLHAISYHESFASELIYRKAIFYFIEQSMTLPNSL